MGENRDAITLDDAKFSKRARHAVHRSDCLGVGQGLVAVHPAEGDPIRAARRAVDEKLMDEHPTLPLVLEDPVRKPRQCAIRKTAPSYRLQAMAARAVFGPGSTRQGYSASTGAAAVVREPRSLRVRLLKRSISPATERTSRRNH